MTIGQVQTFYYMSWCKIEDQRKAKIAEEKEKELEKKRKAEEEKKTRALGGRAVPLRRAIDKKQQKPQMPKFSQAQLDQLADEFDD